MIKAQHIDSKRFIVPAMLGTTAITAIACHVTGICDLYVSSRFFVLPAFLLILLCCVLNREVGKNIIRGWVYGVIAVTIYDLSRIPFMMAGWGDFIPTIGDWLTGQDQVHAFYGYAWRYIGNGGGLGITFVLVNRFVNPKFNRIWLGIIYGLTVWICLDIVLIVSPAARELMFDPNLLNATGSFIGHLVFGLVLGLLFNQLKSNSKTQNIPSNVE